MAEFDDKIDEYLLDVDSTDDIRITVRRAWFYNFKDAPLRIWDGQGRLFTSDGNIWLGSISAGGRNHHKAPALADGRDGSSASYNMTLDLIDTPGVPAQQLYQALKEEQTKVTGRKVTCYLVLFLDAGEGLRPVTPISYLKELNMFAPKFSEKIEQDSSGVMVRKYSINLTCKDGNFGRSNVPNGTYTDAIQRERARQLGVTTDRGCEYVGILANRTYQMP